MEDYMIDETIDEWKSGNKGKEDSQGKDEALKSKDLSQVDAITRKKLFKRRYPEFIPLTKEYKKLKSALSGLTERRDGKNEVVEIKFATLSSYLGIVATYFALFLSKLQAEEQFSMKNEPIMASIVQSRQIWYQAKDLPEDLVEDTDDEGRNEADEGVNEDVGVDDEDVGGDDKDVGGNNDDDVSEDANGVNDDDDMLNFHLSGKQEIKHLKPKNLEDIDEVDAEEKRHRKRTLGFYTSKIDQREKKKFTKFQGDEDIPYKERLFERQQRLIEEARKRGDRGNKNAPGADLDDEDMNEDDMKIANSVNGTENASGEEYYEKVKSQKAARKAARRHAHEEAVKAARSGRLAELSENMDENGKRAINYQILKNRGLTKKRKKENRNARVKKRRKFAKAQKKLKSVRAVYQTPEGPYQGEKSGIKKNISRSVKLV